jgi:hypothetical protein
MATGRRDVRRKRVLRRRMRARRDRERKLAEPFFQALATRAVGAIREELSLQMFPTHPGPLTAAEVRVLQGRIREMGRREWEEREAEIYFWRPRSQHSIRT